MISYYLDGIQNIDFKNFEILIFKIIDEYFPILKYILCN